MMDNLRDELKRAADRLEELEHVVPVRAEAFHELRRAVLQKVKIRTPVHAWRLLRSPDVQNRLREAQEVAALGEKLVELLHDCDSLQERITAVENLVRSCPDPAVSGAADSHLAPQRKTLSLIGTGVDSLDALEPAQNRAANLRTTLDGVSRAVPLFSEAIQIHRRLAEADDLGAAAIAADLKRWRSDFLRSAQSPGWLESVSTALDAHRARLANQPQPELPRAAPAREPSPLPPQPAVRPPPITSSPISPPPPPAPVAPRYSLAQIEDLLSESREWATALTGDIEEVRPLADRKHSIASAAPAPEAINELGDAVQELRDRFKSDAIQKAGLCVDTFNRWIHIYTEQCGFHPGLQASSETLRRDRVTLPEDYSDFEENFNRAQARFRGLINNDQGKLHEALLAAAASLRAACDAVRRSRRTIEADHQLGELEKRIPSPAKLPPQPAMQSIEELEICIDVESGLRSLETLCRETANAAEGRREGLARRLVRLQTLLERFPELQAGVNPIVQALERSAQWPAGALLDTCESELAHIQSQMDAAEAAARGSADAKLKDLYLFFETADLELSAIHPGEETFQCSEPGGSDIAAYVEALDRAGEYDIRLKGRLAAAIESIRGRLPSLAQQITEAGADDNAEVSDGVASSLLMEYGELPFDAADVQTLSQLRQWMQQSEVFLYSIQRARQDTREEINELRSRLNALRRQGGDGYYPRLLRRVEALVTGVAADTSLPESAASQLTSARRLLEALERDAIHRIAEEVETAKTRIELEMKRTRDPEFASNARLVLRDLQRHDEHKLPSPAIVRQLRLLTNKAMRGAAR